MKRWMVMLAGLLVLFFLPNGRRTELRTLKPAEILYVYIEEERICVATDTGDTGRGITLTASLEDMKAASSGVIFLETVSHLLVTEETRPLLEPLSRILRPGTLVLLATGKADPETAAQYLAVHRTDLTLGQCTDSGVALPKLMIAGERYYLEQPESYG